MTLKALTARAKEIRSRFRDAEIKKCGRAWTRSDIMAGFVGDVGALSKIVMACEGLRDLPDKDAKLKHELADCLWSLLVLADEYGVDLEKEFFATMDEIEQKLDK